MLDSFWHQGLGLGERALDVLRSFGLAKELEAVSLPMGTEINLLANSSGPPLELHRDELYQHRRSDPAVGFLALESPHGSDWALPSHGSTSWCLGSLCWSNLPRSVFKRALAGRAVTQAHRIF